MREERGEKIKRLSLLLVLLFLLNSCAVENAESADKPGTIRSVPYPFKAMLAVCSDIDGTTLREFEVYHKYLNTNEETYLGTGLGLDIADSFWFFAVNDDGAVIDFKGEQNSATMSYYRPGAKELKNNEEIIKYFQCGWIDSMHSYGDFSRVDTSKPVFTAKHAEMAHDEMLENSLLPSVWINHGNAANVQNILNPASPKKKELSYQQGANPESEYYHADFTIPAGIKYVWFSNFSSDFSVKTPLYPVTLEDGQRVWGFNRYTGETEWLIKHRYNWSVYGFNEQVSEKHLDKLVADGGVAIVAQHLGGSNGDYVFPADAKEGFERLKQYQDNGDILVIRTSRLLEFVRVRDYLIYEYTETENGEEINILGIDDPVLGFEEVHSAEQLSGITFNVKDSFTAQIKIGGAPVDKQHVFRSGSPDPTKIGLGRQSDKDYTDYTKQ